VTSEPLGGVEPERLGGQQFAGRRAVTNGPPGRGERESDARAGLDPRPPATAACPLLLTLGDGTEPNGIVTHVADGGRGRGECVGFDGGVDAVTGAELERLLGVAGVSRGPATDGQTVVHQRAERQADRRLGHRDGDEFACRSEAVGSGLDDRPTGSRGEDEVGVSEGRQRRPGVVGDEVVGDELASSGFLLGCRGERGSFDPECVCVLQCQVTDAADPLDCDEVVGVEVGLPERVAAGETGTDQRRGGRRRQVVWNGRERRAVKEGYTPRSRRPRGRPRSTRARGEGTDRDGRRHRSHSSRRPRGRRRPTP